MFGVFRIAAEILAALVDIVSFSFAMHHLAASDPIKAVMTIGIGVASVIGLAATVIACEIAKWYVTQYLRERELLRQNLGRTGLEGSGDKSGN